MKIFDWSWSGTWTYILFSTQHWSSFLPFPHHLWRRKSLYFPHHKKSICIWWAQLHLFATLIPYAQSQAKKVYLVPFTPFIKCLFLPFALPAQLMTFSFLHFESVSLVSLHLMVCLSLRSSIFFRGEFCLDGLLTSLFRVSQSSSISSEIGTYGDSFDLFFELLGPILSSSGLWHQMKWMYSYICAYMPDKNLVFLPPNQSSWTQPSIRQVPFIMNNISIFLELGYANSNLVTKCIYKFLWGLTCMLFKLLAITLLVETSNAEVLSLRREDRLRFLPKNKLIRIITMNTKVYFWHLKPSKFELKTTVDVFYGFF